MGAEVASNYRPPDDPAECSWLFIAIDPSVFGDGAAIMARAEVYVNAAESSRRVVGTESKRVPDRTGSDRSSQAEDQVLVARSTMNALGAFAAEFGLSDLAAFRLHSGSWSEQRHVNCCRWFVDQLWWVVHRIENGSLKVIQEEGDGF